MSKSLQEIAELVAGKVLVDDTNLLITEAAGIDQAGVQSITFALEEFVPKAAQSSAAAVILPLSVTEFNKPCICVADPKEAFSKLVVHFAPQVQLERNVHPMAWVHPSAKLGENVAVMPFAVIDKDAQIGDNCVIYPNVYVGQGVVIGADCILHAGSVVREFCVLGNRVVLQNSAIIGGDGFGYTTNNKKHTKVPQLGNVVLCDDVEVGSCTCIDRATIYKTSTVVGAGTKLDNLVHLGHNDIVGENCFFVAQVGISGSVKIGDNCTFAGQVGSAGHLQIGDNCTFAARSGITNSVQSNSLCAGFPAIPHKEWLRQEAHKSKLPNLNSKLKELEKRLAALENSSVS